MLEKQLTGALPSGSLQKPCLELWGNAGYCIRVDERSLTPSVDDPELDLILMRPQDIPYYVALGNLDFGICGYDCMVERGCETRVKEMAELVFSKVSRKPTRWVLAVKDASPFQTVKDLQGKRIATEFVTMTRAWLLQKQVDASVEHSWGATEVKPGRVCDAIVEVTESGASLMRNGLRIIDDVLQSTPRFIANPAAFEDPWKREKMEDIVLMLKGSMDAEGKVGLMLNVSAANLEAVLGCLPALRSPTVSSLAKKGWFALNTIVGETTVRVMIPQLKRAGAVDIVEYRVSKLIANEKG